MSDGALDVVLPEPPVEGDGFGELRDISGGTAGESSAAGNGGFFHKFNLPNLRGLLSKVTRESTLWLLGESRPPDFYHQCQKYRDCD